MASDIRMVFLDIDGTLVYRRSLVPSAMEAVRRLTETDVEIALCTGRSRIHAMEILNTLGLSQCVYFNGGLVERAGDKLSGDPLHPHVVLRMIQFFESKKIPIILHTHTQAVGFHPVMPDLQEMLDDYNYPEIEIMDLDDWNSTRPETYQANIFCGPEWDDEIRSLFPECLLYRWESNGADLQQLGCDKSIGASVLLEHLNIGPHEAMHIGDGGNDIGMFRYLGTSVAMGNAQPDVKKHAQFVTSSADEDGVYQALQALGLI